MMKQAWRLPSILHLLLFVIQLPTFRSADDIDLPKLIFDKGILVNGREVDYSKIPKIDGVLELDKNGECIPKLACYGTDITTIPYMVNHVSWTFMQKYELYDSRKLRYCLKGKRVVLLGDSTMGETFHDFSIVLSGIGKVRSDLDEYIYQAAIKSEKEREFWTYPLPNDVNLNYYCCRRNLTLEMTSSDIEIAYRFIGNPVLTRNDYGVKTLLDEGIQEELYCILGLLPGCPVPDVVIINSGLHDRYVSIEEFNRNLRKVSQCRKMGTFSNTK